MRNTLNYFYRHPDPIYFSLEKLFTAIGNRIASAYPESFQVEDCTLPFPSKWTKILSNMRYAKKHQGDINHISGAVQYALLPFGRDRINVLTIHDCVMLRRYSAGNPRYWLLKWFWYELPVRKADAVTVISESTKMELLHFTSCKPEKIRVISNFVDADYRHYPSSFNSEYPRILFVGSTPNKNLERLIPAIQGLPVKLEIVGQLDHAQRQLLKEHNIDYHQSSGLSREALMEKYIQCDLLAFPSTYEGFGLPIIEAQAIGRPVLTSDIAPMNEVSGEGARLVDPHRIDSIREGILHLLKDAAYRDEIIGKGIVNVERFRLVKVAEQYATLYKELLIKKSNS